MNVLIVDDEFDARRTIRKMLSEKFPEISFLNDASTIDEARIQLMEESTDIVFLDIQIGSSKVFELLDTVEIQAEIIFVTAYDNFALEAFKHQAVNYILKPIERQKIYAAFEKATILSESKKTKHSATDSLDNEYINKLILPGSKSAKVVDTQTIVYIRAEGVYCRLFFVDGSSILCAKPLRYLEEKLSDNPDFTRTHKSYMININSVESIGGDGSFLSVGGEELIPVSRSKKEQLKVVLKNRFY